jgi:pimeloyl-ACP methyl ester carboxylesterase
LWLAAQPASTRPPLRGVVGLAAIADLRDYGQGAGDCNQSVAKLMAGAPDKVPERYATASPSERLPIGVPLRLFNGSEDGIVTPAHAEGFVAKASAAGDSVEYRVIDGAGHFDLVMPDAPASRAIQDAIRRLLDQL